MGAWRGVLGSSVFLFIVTNSGLSAVVQGADPAEVARRWIEAEGARLPGDLSDLRLNHAQSTSGPRFASLSFDQYLNGIRVEGAVLRIALKKINANLWGTVLTKADLAPRALQAQSTLSSDQARARAERADKTLKDLGVASAPELVYLWQRDFDDPQLVWAWDLESPSLTNPLRKIFFLRASNGEIVSTRNLVSHHEYQAELEGWVLPDLDPYWGPESLQPAPLPLWRVDYSVDGSNWQTDFADASGHRLISSPARPLWIRSFIDSPLVTLVDALNQPIEILMSQFEPGPASMMFNSMRTEFATAHLEAVRQIEITRKFIQDEQVNLPGNETEITARTNINSSCNAYFTPGSVNFYRESANCWNTAYSTLITHEYGHHLVHSRGLAQGAFGEGFADSLALMVHKTDTFGRNFYKDGRSIRVPVAAHVTYPCLDNFHTCGQTLGGIWTELRPLLSNAPRSFLDWASITNGGDNYDSAHSETAIEVLTVLDDDLTFTTGVPKAVAVCRVFADYGISCPELGPLKIVSPPPEESAAQPLQPFEVRFRSLAPQSTDLKAALYYKSHGDSEFQQVTMQRRGQDFVGLLPRRSCLERVDYYIELVGGDFMRVTYPLQAPEQLASVWYASSMRTIGPFGFGGGDTQGWTTTNDLATQGGWQLWDLQNPPASDPIGPFEDSDGTQEYWTSREAMDLWFMGEAWLRSPVFAASSTKHYRASFDYAARLRYPNNQSFQVFQLADSAPVGSGLSLSNTESLWRRSTFDVDSTLIPAGVDGHLQLGFYIQSNWPGSIMRAALDHIEIKELGCHQHCPADLNDDGRADKEDMALFFENLGPSPHPRPRIDINGDGVLNDEDVREFMASLTSGCR